MSDYNTANGYAKRKDDFTNGPTKFQIWDQSVGVLRDFTGSVHDIEYTTDLTAATQLTFTVMRGRFTFIPRNGDQVIFEWNGIKIFTGWIFKRSLTQDEDWAVTAYANSRYLKGTGTYVWPASSSSERFDRIMRDLRLPYKISNKNGHKVAEEVTDGTTFFDMITKPMESTLLHTGERFMIYDDPDGTVRHINTSSLATNLVLGDAANLSTYRFDASIEDTSNVIQVIHEDGESKKREMRVARDDKSVERWGPLFHTETESGDINTAQLQSKANSLLRTMNKEQKNLRLVALGDVKFRAGISFLVSVSALSGVGVPHNTQVIATSVTHHFGTNWTMDLECEIL